MQDWKPWYGRARHKSNYTNQADDLLGSLVKAKEVVPGFDLNNLDLILDVGCGDFRLQPLFKEKRYLGIDKFTTDHDITNPNDWVGLPDFDLAFTSLTLVTLSYFDAGYVIGQMLLKSKWVFLYEETNGREEQVAEDKWRHDYSKFFTQNQTDYFHVQSSINENWHTYLFKGFL